MLPDWGCDHISRRSEASRMSRARSPSPTFTRRRWRRWVWPAARRWRLRIPRPAHSPRNAPASVRRRAESIDAASESHTRRSSDRVVGWYDVGENYFRTGLAARVGVAAVVRSMRRPAGRRVERSSRAYSRNRNENKSASFSATRSRTIWPARADTLVRPLHETERATSSPTISRDSARA
jgi:hypothetical protein